MRKLGNTHVPRLLCIIPKNGRFYRKFAITTRYYEYYKQHLVNVINNKKFVLSPVIMHNILPLHVPAEKAGLK